MTGVDDDTIRILVTRLERPHASGGKVVERAAILAEGADFAAVVRWIASHAGEPEDLVPTVSRRGLHGSRINTDPDAARTRMPPRCVVLQDRHDQRAEERFRQAQHQRLI